MTNKDWLQVSLFQVSFSTIGLVNPAPTHPAAPAMGMHQLQQVSYTIKRKPLSALSNVLRKYHRVT